MLDGHCSHESVELLDLAKREQVHILALPPYTTHALQPLDRTVFGSLSKAYDTISSSFMSESPNNVVNKKVWPRLFFESCQMTITSHNVVSGFRACGIFPFNPDVVLNDTAFQTIQQTT